MSCNCVEYVDKRKEEYQRLIKLPKIAIEKGDLVVVAVGLVGHGYEWVRKECRVLKVRKNSAKITFEGKGLKGEDWWVLWVERALVTDRLGHKNSSCDCTCHFRVASHCCCCN